MLVASYCTPPAQTQWRVCRHSMRRSNHNKVSLSLGVSWPEGSRKKNWDSPNDSHGGDCDSPNVNVPQRRITNAFEDLSTNISGNSGLKQIMNELR